MIPVRILALDLAMKTGWAIDSGGRPEVTCGTYQCRETGEDDGLGFFGLRCWLDNVIAGQKPELVAYEAPITFGGKNKTPGEGVPFTNDQALLWLHGLVAITKSCAAGAGIPHYPVNIGAARTGFIGHQVKGRENGKRAVFERAKMLQLRPVDDNASDGVAIWYWAKAHLRRNGDEIVRI